MLETNLRVGYTEHSCGNALKIPEVTCLPKCNSILQHTDVLRKNDFSPSIADRLIDLQLLIF